ncbi:MAG TPA: tetratricopeptide repeat protein [Gammaproteobacteria bacterium]
MKHQLPVLLLCCALLPAAPLASPLGTAVAAHEAGDHARARELLLPLAEQGSIEAAYRLGTLYAFGQGGDVDHARAAQWYERAARADHHQAALTLGNMYLSGLGVPLDQAAALAWFERAAEIAERRALEVEECD